MIDDVLFDGQNIEEITAAFDSVGSAQLIVYTDSSVKNNIGTVLSENKVLVIV